jgi:hypothetical protein
MTELPAFEIDGVRMLALPRKIANMVLRFEIKLDTSDVSSLFCAGNRYQL